MIRLVLAVVILLGAEHQLITRNFFGSMASPEIPFVLLVSFGWLYGAICFTGLLLMLKDIVALLAYLPFKRYARSLLYSVRVPRVIAAIAAILSLIGVWQAVRVPDVKKLEVVLPALPAQLDGFRLVQLTDLHASRLLQAAWMDAVVEKTNALQADLIVITGDLVDGTPEARHHDIQPLRKLQAKQGVYAIPGNHEYYADYASWLRAFRDLGLPMLLNQHVTITQNDASFVLAGVTDTIAPNFRETPPDLAAALKDAPSRQPIILLAHRPIDALANATSGVSLQLSGHTHGGQILGFHKVVQWANQGFVSGLYKVNDMQLYVSNGTGLWAGLPIRLGRPSEITEITLRAR
ncbi:MAG: metallophosphoesterase [Oxalicibacterium faecigallinarum]|uniref:metallophosphoesterase n=1 Tax=Oxalicibacterium faecigallinarum TaxID=573741 RepID=UPI0028073C0B|nr:metallophosphoesterase [Oxalicibacterium faecigallinarum]MDQ7968037.1 metallophosphoesterase [Oxalicibacterium faecigallinarum]